MKSLKTKRSGQGSSSSHGGPRKTGPFTQLIVFGVFLFFGWVSLQDMFLAPLRLSRAMGGWRETRCTIVSSEVVGTTAKGGTVYDVKFLYTYQVDGRTYQGTRQHYRPVLAPGRTANTEIARRNPPGAVVPCWFDPESPEDVVLDRELEPFYAVALFPLLIVAVGSGGIVWTLLGGRANVMKGRRRRRR